MKKIFKPFVTEIKMNYAKLDTEEFSNYIESYRQDLERKECNISKTPIIMGLKLLDFLSTDVDPIFTGHDILYGASWGSVRDKIIEYDVELLITNGWFIEDGCWAHFT